MSINSKVREKRFNFLPFDFNKHNFTLWNTARRMA